MKYLFIAHSHTLCLSDLGTINLLGLKPGDCVFVFTRNFKCDYIPQGCKIVDGNDFYSKSHDAYMQQNHGLRNRLIQALDSEINSWLNDEYEAYLPHMCDPYAMLLATNKRCRKVSFVQEAAFTVKERFEVEKPFLRKLLDKIESYRIYHTTRFYGCNWYVDGQLHQKTIDTYSLYPEYFKYLPSDNHTITWPKIELDVDIDTDGVYFIMDGYVKNGMAESEVYLTQCRDMIRQFKGGCNYVKFHPNQSKEECDTILSFFEDEKVEVMSQDIPFELYITNGRNLSIVGMTSSLLFLAKKQGHRVISCDSWMMQSPKFRKLHDEGMPLFHEYFDDEQPTQKTVE